MTTIIKIRRDTTINWEEANPILALGEPGYNTDTLSTKIGDGVTPWIDLPYSTSGNALFAETANVANSVNVANVEGIGNIATVNLDGNVSNALRGDGSFGPVDSVGTSIDNGMTSVSIPTSNGNVIINVNDGTEWIFDDTGRVTIPNDGYFGALNSEVLGLSSQNNKPIFLEVIDTGNSAARQWVFDNSGNLTLPGNTFSVNYANGTQVPLGGGSSGNSISDGENTLRVNNDGSLSFPGYGKIDTATNSGTFTIYPNTSDLDYGIDMFISYDNDIHIQSANVDKGIALGKSYGSGAHVRIVGNVAYGTDSAGDIVVQPQDYVGGTQQTFRFDTDGALNLPNNGVIRHEEVPGPGLGPVNMVSDIYSQLQWAPYQSASSANPNDANPPKNWVFVDEIGTKIENILSNTESKSWHLDIIGRTLLPNNIMGYSSTYGLWPNEYDDLWFTSSVVEGDYIYAVASYYFYDDAYAVVKFNKNTGELIWSKQFKSGTGASFDISYNNDNVYTLVSIANPGSGYKVGQNIYIPGWWLGGQQPQNMLTINILSVDGSGGITDVTLSGTAPNGSNTYNGQNDPMQSVMGDGVSISKHPTNGSFIITGTQYTYQGNTLDNEWQNTNIFTIDNNGNLIADTKTLKVEADIYPIDSAFNSDGSQKAVVGYLYGNYSELGAIDIMNPAVDYFELDTTQFSGEPSYPGDGVTWTGAFYYTGTGIMDQTTASYYNQYFACPTTVRQGSGAQFSVSASGGVYTIDSIIDGGGNYRNGHQIKVLGTDLGGATPANDLIISVATVGDLGTGTITTVNVFSGTADIGASGPYTVSGTNYNVGSGATFNVDLGSSTGPSIYVYVANGGSNYVLNDVLYVDGAIFAGGISVTNNLTLVVGGHYGGGNINYINNAFFATPPNWTVWRIGISGVDFTSPGGSWSVKVATGSDAYVYTDGWNKTIGSGGQTYERYHGVTFNEEDTEIYTVGVGRFSNADDQGIVSKFLADGTHQWTKAINYDQLENARCLGVTTYENDLFVTGVQYDTTAGNNDVFFLTKLDSDGTILWQKKYYYTDDPYCDSIGNPVVVNGFVYVGWGQYNGDVSGYILAKINASNGNLVWAKNIYNSDNDMYFDYNQETRNISTDGEYVYLTGYTYVPTDYYYNGALIKIACNDYLSNTDNGVYAVKEVVLGITVVNVVSPSVVNITPVITPNLITTTTNERDYVTGNTDITLGNHTQQFINELVGIHFGDGTVQNTTSGIQKQILKTQYQNYTVTLFDAGKHIYCGPQGRYGTIYLPDYETEDNLPVGFKFTVINRSNDRIYLYINNGNSTDSYIYGSGMNNYGSGWYIDDNGSGTVVHLTLVEKAYSDDNGSHGDVWMIEGPSNDIGVD